MGINARKYEKDSIVGKVRLRGEGAPATAGIIDLGVAPCDGEVVDIIHAQRNPGIGGNFAEFEVFRQRVNAAVSLTPVQSRLTLASGFGVAVDADKKIDAVAGSVRPTLPAAIADRRVKKGDTLHAVATYNGVYGTPPVSQIAVIIRPDN